MAAGKYDFLIEKGAAFEPILTWKDSAGTLVNLSGYTARMHMRERYDSTTPFIILTTENGGITLGGAAGTITLYISPANTAAIAASGGVYDLELIPASGKTRRIFQGKIIISEEVTR